MPTVDLPKLCLASCKSAACQYRCERAFRKRTVEEIKVFLENHVAGLELCQRLADRDTSLEETVLEEKDGGY